MLHRDKRVAEAIKIEVARIITNDLSDPKLGFVTVIGVKLTRDFKLATVYVSVMGDQAKRDETINHLQGARGHIRSLLKDRITLRYLPEIRFQYDTLLAEEERVAQLLRELHQGESAGEEESAE